MPLSADDARTLQPAPAQRAHRADQARRGWRNSAGGAVTTYYSDTTVSNGNAWQAQLPEGTPDVAETVSVRHARRIACPGTAAEPDTQRQALQPARGDAASCAEGKFMFFGFRGSPPSPGSRATATSTTSGSCLGCPGARGIPARPRALSRRPRRRGRVSRAEPPSSLRFGNESATHAGGDAGLETLTRLARRRGQAPSRGLPAWARGGPRSSASFARRGSLLHGSPCAFISATIVPAAWGALGRGLPTGCALDPPRARRSFSFAGALPATRSRPRRAAGIRLRAASFAFVVVLGWGPQRWP